VIHGLGRLQVDQQHRGAAALRDGHEHRRGHVRGEEADDEVAAGRPQLLGRPRPVLGVGNEADVDDVTVDRTHSLRDASRRSLQLGQQIRELRPVGAESAGHQTDLGATPDHPL